MPFRAPLHQSDKSKNVPFPPVFRLERFSLFRFCGFRPFPLLILRTGVCAVPGSTTFLPAKLFTEGYKRFADWLSLAYVAGFCVRFDLSSVSLTPPSLLFVSRSNLMDLLSSLWGFPLFSTTTSRVPNFPLFGNSFVLFSRTRSPVVTFDR